MIKGDEEKAFNRKSNTRQNPGFVKNARKPSHIRISNFGTATMY